MRRPLISFASWLACLPLIVVTVAEPPSAWADAEAGEELFESAASGNCGTCHYANTQRKVGPGLQDVTKRRSAEWLHLWLKDPQATWRSDHPDTLALREETRKLRSRATSCVKKPMAEQGVTDLMDYLGTLLSEEPVEVEE